MSGERFDIVVVGGGFSGAVLAVQLLRRIPNLSVAVIDKGRKPGHGLAYGTPYPCHLLNVPACNMSAFPDESDHFLLWAKANYGPQIRPTTFLPRAIYGRYVRSILEEFTEHRGTPKLRWIRGEVSSVRCAQTRTLLELTDGTELNTDFVVLSVGNFPPATLKVPGLSAKSIRYVRSPWSANPLRDIPKDGSVLLIGSGLTSVDLAVALESEGFRGHIHILSRHGLLPQTHARFTALNQPWREECPPTIRGLLHLVREKVRGASESGADWREIVDGLRPVTQQIWQSFSEAERKRFLRHVRPYWDVHRHRIAPEIGDTIAKLLHAGQLTVYAGRLTNYREFTDRTEVEFRDRETGVTRELTVDRVINCTGPETDCRRVEDPLVRNLLAQGLARPDPLFLGLDVDQHGALIHSSGTSSSSIYVIGPARKGSLWETIAVPELRVQASALAEDFVCKLRAKALTGQSAFALAEISTNPDRLTP